MHLETIATGTFQANCFLVWTEDKRAVVVDPGSDAEHLIQAVAQLELRVELYLCTHGHTDHIHALADLHERIPAPIAMHPLDWCWAFEPCNQLSPYYSRPRKPSGAEYLPLQATMDWNNPFGFQCIETPGHTPGSCCILFPDEKILLSGDTLFRGSCGRTDLQGGDPRQMKASLDKLKQLDDGIRVYPGHGPSTTIGIERRTNIYMG